LTVFRVAVVGLGIGRAHLAAWRSLAGRFEIAAVCDLDEGLARKQAEKFGAPFATQRFDDLLARTDLDVIDICTPPMTHRELAERALAAGKHVVCEKPLTGSLADADALIAAAARGPGLLMPIFQYRFGNGLLRLRRLHEHGIPGRLHVATVETHWKRGTDYYAVPWRGKWATELGGALTTHAIHAHDILCSIGGPVASVFAHIATRVNPIETEDCAVATVRFSSGALATLSTTLGSAVEISRLRLCFEHLTAESALEPYLPSTDPWTFSPASPEVGAHIRDALAGFVPGAEGYAGQFARLHDALEGRADLPVTTDDARASLELLTALYHSAATGAPVSLPIRSEHPRYRGWAPAGR
jgi:predicted dehydrogenase